LIFFGFTNVGGAARCLTSTFRVEAERNFIGLTPVIAFFEAAGRDLAF